MSVGFRRWRIPRFRVAPGDIWHLRLSKLRVVRFIHIPSNQLRKDRKLLFLLFFLLRGFWKWKVYLRFWLRQRHRLPIDILLWQRNRNRLVSILIINDPPDLRRLICHLLFLLQIWPILLRFLLLNLSSHNLLFFFKLRRIRILWVNFIFFAVILAARLLTLVLVLGRLKILILILFFLFGLLEKGERIDRIGWFFG